MLGTEVEGSWQLRNESCQLHQLRGRAEVPGVRHQTPARARDKPAPQCKKDPAARMDFPAFARRRRLENISQRACPINTSSSREYFTAIKKKQKRR